MDNFPQQRSSPAKKVQSLKGALGIMKTSLFAFIIFSYTWSFSFLMWRVSLSEQYNNNNDRLLIPVILYIAGLLQKIIPQQTQDLEDEFNDISIQTYDKIEKDYTVNQFKARLMTLPIKCKEEHEDFFQQIENELEKESTINSIWIKLSKYWNFMNYTLLENLIRNIGDRSLKQNMKSYLSSLETFRRNTRLCDFAEHCPAVESRPSEADLKEFVLHLKLDWETCTLEQLEELKGHIIRKFLLPSFALILKKVSHGSLIVTWLLPAQIASTLVQDLENTDNKGFFKEYKIECMTIDGKEYKYSSIPKYAAFLKDTYSTMEGKNLTAFKLARIWKEKIDRRKMDSFTKSTIRGDKDDVIYKKYPMTEGEVTKWKPRLVVIEGAPGVGKTTFSEQFCFKWSQGQRLNDHTLLVLLPLRDNRVRSAKSISDLFHHPQLQGAIAQEVESSQGEGVVLWLEAWDELEQRMREESSIFLDLVHGRKLPKATIIITSRPWATNLIIESTSIRVDQHIELVTTPTLELSRVLRDERVHPDIRSKFLDYVSYYPAMKAAMHTPVTANIVTDVFKWSRDMESTPPTTVTQLYTAYTCNLLMQHFSGHKAHGKQSWKIGSLEDLPPDVHQQVLALSKLAWEGIMKQQLTFCSADIGGVTLGLMESVKELYRGQDAELSYHFIHLTLQEFLAAYHITQLPLHTQQQLIREHVKVGHLSVVMKFYFGLSKFNTFTSEMIREHISDFQSAAAYHWMYEAGDTEAVSNLLASRELIKVLSSREWSPLDYFVVGHFMAYSQSEWKLCFRYSYMGNEGIEMFSKGLMKMRAVTWNGEITSADFSYCDIHSIEHFVNIPHPILQQFIELDFRDNKLDIISSTRLSELLTCSLTSLRTLILDSCGITSEGAVQLSAGLAVNKSITKLQLRKNPIGDIGAASIGDAIKTNAVLEHLHMNHCEIASEGAVQLSAGLAINKSLTRLKLWCNPIGDIGAASIGDAIKTNAVLEYLDIIDCEIASEGAVQLSAGLAINKSLTRLKLWCNPIGDIGAASIGDAIKTNAVLEHLDIPRCEITSQGCIHIAAALSENSTLLILRMKGNAIGVEGAKAMSEMLEKNISLKELHLHRDYSYEEGVDVILSSLQQNTSLTQLWLPNRYKRPADPRVKWW